MGDHSGTNKHRLPPEGAKREHWCRLSSPRDRDECVDLENGISPCSPLLDPAESSGVAY